MADRSLETSDIQIDSALEVSSGDSAYGDEIADYTQSLTSSVTHFNWKNGRRYHSQLSDTDHSYPLPNDDQEQNRLDIMSHVIKLLLNGRMFLAPLPLPGSALRVLDVGTGTGIWAMEMGDAYPECEIVGNDISPIQPQWVPANVQFEVDDITAVWPERPPFDYIHSRYMAGSIPDWPAFMQQCHNNLRPGGWVEFQDLDIHHYSEDNSIAPENHVYALHELLIEACDRAGRTLRPGRQLKQWAEEAGFVNVREEVFRIPLGMWPKDRRLKEIGYFHQLQMLEGSEGFCMELYTKVLGWSPEDVQLFLVGVRKDSKDRSAHMMYNFHIVYGQKPYDSRVPMYE